MQLANFFLSLQGRANRKQYWKFFVLPLLIIGLVIVVVAPPLLFDKFVMGYWLATLWPAIAAGTKRCHDRGRSGWFQLIVFIPLVGFIWLAAELLFLGGTQGANRFGPDPKQATADG